LLCGVGLGIGIVFHSCKKDDPVNPFDDPSLQPPDAVTFVETLDPNGFAYLHKYIFKPTCANSGCHDGTFEPDFRTIYSAYNTLVYQPVIQNDPSNTFSYRVQPGNADLSIIHERLLNFIPNSSGIMPLSVDPGSDWEANKATYIQNITNWIDNGAEDMYGNLPTLGNLHPEVIGIVGFPSGNTSVAFGRIDGNNSPFDIPQGSIIDLWFAVSDDETPSNQLTFNQYKIQSTPFDFSATSPGSLQIVSPITANDLWGNPVSFTHKTTIDLSTYPVGSYLYVRTYLQDADHLDPVELPNDGSSNNMLSYFTIKIT
jgi:hypothetical protein